MLTYAHYVMKESSTHPLCMITSTSLCPRNRRCRFKIFLDPKEIKPTATHFQKHILFLQLRGRDGAHTALSDRREVWNRYYKLCRQETYSPHYLYKKFRCLTQDHESQEPSSSWESNPSLLFFLFSKSHAAGQAVVSLTNFGIGKKVRNIALLSATGVQPGFLVLLSSCILKEKILYASISLFVGEM